MNKKRLVSIVMSLIVAFSMAGILVSADDNPIYDADAEFKTAEQLLKMTGIIKDSDSFAPEEEISRGHFTAMASRALKVNDCDTDVRTMFRDVSSENKWAREIAGMYSTGYIKGDNKRRFYPDDKITINEVATIAVNCLGFKQQAELKGGWPTGYLIEARRLNLIPDKDGDAAVTQGESAVIIKNMLEAEAVIPFEVYTSGSLVRRVEKNLLSKLHKVYTVEGIVTENGVTGLFSKDVDKDSISVGGIRVQNINGEDLSGLIGLNLKLYCRENDGDYEYMMIKSSDRSKIYTMNGWDDDVEYDRSGNLVKFSENNKIKTLRMSNDFKFIYNGKLEGNYLKYTGDFSESTVKIIENSDDSLCDVMIVESYNTLVADEVGNTATSIVSVYTGFPPVKPEDYQRVDFTDMNGSSLSISDISRGDVISWYASADNSYAKIVKSSLSLSGKISGAEPTEGKYTINGKSYKTAPTVKSGAVRLEIGKEGSFSLDIFGRIADFSKYIDSSEGFGMLIRYGNGDEADEGMQVKILNEYHELRAYTLAEKAKIDGITRKKDELYSIIDSKSKLNDEDGAKKEDIIKFKTDSDGNISSIDFALAYIPEKDKVIDGTLYMYKKKATRPYKEETGNMNDDFIIDKSSTVVFGIDTNFEYGNDERYFVMSGSSFGNDAFITAEAYTTKKEPDKAEAIVYYGLPSGNATNFFAINTISNTLNSFDEPVYKATGFTPAGDCELIIDSRIVEKYSLTAGDIVGGTSKVDINGMLYDTELLYDYSEKKMVTNVVGDGYFFHERAFMIYPYSHSGNVIKWFMTESRDEAEAQFRSTGITEDALRNTIVPSGAIYVADGSTKGSVYKKGNMADIVSYVQDPDNYSDIIVRSRWGNTQLIVVINK